MALIRFLCLAGAMLGATGEDGTEEPVKVDYIVVGAGPSGLQVTRELHRLGRSYLTLERGPSVGTFFTRFPRHRKLISINKRNVGSKEDPEYALRHDWNSLLGDDVLPRFTEYTEDMWPHADLMPRYLHDFAEAHGLLENIRFNASVQEISRIPNWRFRVKSTRGVFECSIVIMAAGRPVPNVDKSIPGWEHMVGYDELDTDPELYEGQNVAIIGGGNAAVETANGMEETAAAVQLAGRRSPRLAFWTHYPGDLRAVHLRTVDRFFQQPGDGLGSIPEGGFNVTREEDGRFRLSPRNPEKYVSAWRVPFDRVIRCMGWRPDLSIFDDSARPELTHNGAFPRVTTAYESVNVSGLFFVGALAHSRDYKRSAGGFIHGFRYLASALPHIISLRRDRTPWPRTTIPCCLAEVQREIQSRMKSASSMYQMFGYIGDIFIFPKTPESWQSEGCVVEHLKDVPLELLSSGVVMLTPMDSTFLTLSMEWHPRFRGPGVIRHDKMTEQEWEEEQASLPVDQGDADHDHASRFGGMLGMHPEKLNSNKPAPRSRRQPSELTAFDKFLHPVLRLYERKQGKHRKAVKTAMHHVDEDIYTTWDHSSVIDKLSTFMNKTLADELKIGPNHGPHGFAPISEPATSTGSARKNAVLKEKSR